MLFRSFQCRRIQYQPQPGERDATRQWDWLRLSEYVTLPRRVVGIYQTGEVMGEEVTQVFEFLEHPKRQQRGLVVPYKASMDASAPIADRALAGDYCRTFQVCVQCRPEANNA